ncbi:hypothetical protein RBSWK_03961 [Rhodopirellula baltica SWK14]|uniref:Uncharacterized protein n=1 Tax=Rhodopirellula baltica SWK14 TaxID=993516 RepID=L7CF74_RHOBT|nr:hypothetical protein RBSWK_03961 [Rhodopirellula baltica SWK14]
MRLIEVDQNRRLAIFPVPPLSKALRGSSEELNSVLQRGKQVEVSSETYFKFHRFFHLTRSQLIANFLARSKATD